VRRLHPRTVYLLYCAADGVAFRLMGTIFSVFLILDLDLNPFQLLLLGTVVEGTYLIFEIPTGVVADTISRKLSVVIGLFGTGAAFLLLAVADSFAVAVVSQVMWGIFATFVSGADVAWITDEVGEEHARPLYLRGDQVWQGAALVGVVASVALATLSLRLPLALSGFSYMVLGTFMAFAMSEQGFQRPERTEREGPFRSFAATFKDGVSEVRAHHVLLLILATAALHGASTEGFDRLSDFHLLRDIGLPSLGGLDTVVWFGILDGVSMILGIVAISVVKRRSRLEGHASVAKILMGIDGLLIVSAVVFGLAGQFWVAVAAFWFVGALRTVRDPVFTAWINQGLDPKTRATINSMGSQADAVGQAAGGPMLGLVATKVSTPAALVTSAFLSLPTIGLYLRAIKRGSVGTLEPDEVKQELIIDEDEMAPEVPEGPHATGSGREGSADVP
jgi:MFS transporter, DHA3 family, tetracycline resistance protein